MPLPSATWEINVLYDFPISFSRTFISVRIQRTEHGTEIGICVCLYHIVGYPQLFSHKFLHIGEDTDDADGSGYGFGSAYIRSAAVRI